MSTEQIPHAGPCRALDDEQLLSRTPRKPQGRREKTTRKRHSVKGGMGDKMEARNTNAFAPPRGPQGNIKAKPRRRSCVPCEGSTVPPPQTGGPMRPMSFSHEACS